jgi:hypothetical protein
MGSVVKVELTERLKRRMSNWDDSAGSSGHVNSRRRQTEAINPLRTAIDGLGQ